VLLPSTPPILFTLRESE